MAPRIQIGNVFCAPAVNVVTMTSSKLSAKARSAPETSAVAILGSVTNRNVCAVLAPRSADASSNVFDVLRSRAMTLL